MSKFMKEKWRITEYMGITADTGSPGPRALGDMGGIMFALLFHIPYASAYPISNTGPTGLDEPLISPRTVLTKEPHSVVDPLL